METRSQGSRAIEAQNQILSVTRISMSVGKPWKEMSFLWLKYWPESQHRRCSGNNMLPVLKNIYITVSDMSTYEKQQQLFDL